MERVCAMEPVVQEIARLLSPRTIYLYNQKYNPKGEQTSFKLCVIAQVADKEQAERDIYRQVDCPIPFDILLYTPQEWERLTGDSSTFASRIQNEGTIVYG
ncbi:MAG: hypothetical protein ACOX0K_08605 [Oscillospiraceae bacterium]|jgi:hypothetical protein